MFTLEEMPKMEVPAHFWNENGTFNPFHVDHFSMGRKISKYVYMMCDFFEKDRFRNAYLVDIRTGERQRLVFKDDL